jgi:hypothetical protein
MGFILRRLHDRSSSPADWRKLVKKSVMTKFSLGQVVVPVAQLGSDFTFIVGPNRYPCSLIAASIYCKTIRLLVLSDPTVRSISYPQRDPQSIFQVFIQLLNGQRVSLQDPTAALFLYDVANYFQCDDLIDATSKFLQRFLTPEQCFQGIKRAKIPTRCSAEIEYLATHLPEVLQRDSFSELPLAVLDALLSSQSLNSTGLVERDIVELVYRIVAKNGPEYFGLFAHIAFEEVDPNEMQRFLQNVPSAEIGGALWLAISERLVKPVQPPPDDGGDE